MLRLDLVFHGAHGVHVRHDLVSHGQMRVHLNGLAYFVVQMDWLLYEDADAFPHFVRNALEFVFQIGV